MNVFRQIIRRKSDTQKPSFDQNKIISIQQDIDLLFSKISSPPKPGSDIKFWSSDLKADIQYILNLIESRDFLSEFDQNFDHVELYTTLTNAYLEISFCLRLLSNPWIPNGLDRLISNTCTNLSKYLSSYNNSIHSVTEPRNSSSDDDDDAWDMIKDVVDETHISQFKLAEVKSKVYQDLCFYPDACVQLLNSNLGVVNSRIKEFETFFLKNSLESLSFTNDFHLKTLLYSQVFIKSMSVFTSLAGINSLIFSIFGYKLTEKLSLGNLNRKEKPFSQVIERANIVNNSLISFFKTCDDICQNSTNSSNFIALDLSKISLQFSKLSQSFMSLEDSLASVISDPHRLSFVKLGFFCSNDLTKSSSMVKLDSIRPHESSLSAFIGNVSQKSCHDYVSKFTSPNPRPSSSCIDDFPQPDPISNISAPKGPLLASSFRRSNSDTTKTLLDYEPRINTIPKIKKSITSISNLNNSHVYEGPTHNPSPTGSIAESDEYSEIINLVKPLISPKPASSPEKSRLLSNIDTNAYRLNEDYDFSCVALGSKRRGIRLLKRSFSHLKISKKHSPFPRSQSSPNLSNEFFKYYSPSTFQFNEQSNQSSNNIKNVPINDPFSLKTTNAVFNNLNSLLSKKKIISRIKHSSDDPNFKVWCSDLNNGIIDIKGFNYTLKNDPVLEFPVLQDDGRLHRTANSPFGKLDRNFINFNPLKTSASYSGGLAHKFSVLDIDRSGLDPYELRRTFLRKGSSHSSFPKKSYLDLSSEVITKIPAHRFASKKDDQNSVFVEVHNINKKQNIICRSYSESKILDGETSGTDSPEEGYIVIDSSPSRAQDFDLSISRSSTKSDLKNIQKSESQLTSKIKTNGVSAGDHNINSMNMTENRVSPVPSSNFKYNGSLVEKMQKSLPSIPDQNLISTATIITDNRDFNSPLSDLTCVSEETSPTSHFVNFDPLNMLDKKNVLKSGGLSENFLRSYLTNDYSEKELLVENGKVVGGTLRALVERLTPHDTSVDCEFFYAFLLNFRSFCTPLELLDQLISRYNMNPPAEIESIPSLLEVWESNKKIPSNLRVYNVLKTWLDSYFYLDEDYECLDPLERFSHDFLMKTKPALGARLIQLVRERRTEHSNIASGSIKRINKSKTLDLMFISKFSKVTNLPPPPKHKLSKSTIKSLINNDPINILDINHLELARQLTICESYLYCCIRPYELLVRNYHNSSDIYTFPNTIGMSKMSNQLAHWVIICILSEDTAKSRVKVLKYMIKVANECMVLKNYNALFLFVSAFSSSFISRLKKTWSLLSPKYLTLYDNMQKITDHNRNYSFYRNLLSSTQPPALPFLGIVLTDLTFNDDGNPKFRKTNSLSASIESRDTFQQFRGGKNSSASLKNPSNESPKICKTDTKYLDDTELVSSSESGDNYTNLKNTSNCILFESSVKRPTIEERKICNGLSENVIDDKNPHSRKFEDLNCFSRLDSSNTRIIKHPEDQSLDKNDIVVTNFCSNGESEHDSDELPRINFSKYNRTVKIIENVQKYQIPYNLELITELVEYLQTSLKSAEDLWDEDKYYQRSLALEPRTNK
ncbi:Cell division control protein 25 [Smittium mucronatum]|uniref:Cell division control protein 25 n=1 Tax=Smittium mucronatum TaxID=133383 RepID=A0A1R0GWS9_9FUNG|nr:Cell division control protein 25 [Smittium mucronatum]